MIFQKRYDQILKICRQIMTHRQKMAKDEIEELILAGTSTPPLRVKICLLT